MRITIVGYFPKSGPMSYGSLSYWIVNAWKSNGHEVGYYDRKEMSRMPKTSDIYFFVDCSEDYSRDIPEDLEGLKVTWQMDAQMPGGIERSVNIARKCDYTFMTNYEYGVKILEKFGIESTWIPYGYDDVLQSKILPKNVITKERRDYKYDVCMIGNPNSPERVALWNLLQEKYGDRAFVGTVDNEEEYIKGKSSSYICISQPTEPHNTIINLRVFNALSCGKLLLCKRPTIKEHTLIGLVDGVNVVYWDDFKDLLEKIDYYVKHIEEGSNIAKEGAKLGQKYLMPNQVRFIEQIILSRFYKRLSERVL